MTDSRGAHTAVEGPEHTYWIARDRLAKCQVDGLAGAGVATLLELRRQREPAIVAAADSIKRGIPLVMRVPCVDGSAGAPARRE